MRTKQFRSILALAVVTASVATSLSPAQAFTWEDVLNTIRYGTEGAPATRSPQPSDSSSDTQQPDPQQNGDSNSFGDAQQVNSPKNSDTDSSPTSVSQCVKTSGADGEFFSQDSSESMVSVAQKAVKVSGKLYLGSYNFGTTCSIGAHPPDEKLRFGFAIPDNSGLSGARLTVYIDGQRRISKIISRGQVGKYTIDITGANSYAYSLDRIGDSSGYSSTQHIYYTTGF